MPRVSLDKPPAEYSDIELRQLIRTGLSTYSARLNSLNSQCAAIRANIANQEARDSRIAIWRAEMAALPHEYRVQNADAVRIGNLVASARAENPALVTLDAQFAATLATAQPGSSETDLLALATEYRARGLR